MLGLLLLIPIAALLFLDYFIADEFRRIAMRKGYCARRYFWWCFFLGIVGYMMVIALPNRYFFRVGEGEQVTPLPPQPVTPEECAMEELK